MLEFDEKKIVGKAVIEREITEVDIDNIMVTALEGGVNYWAGLDNTGVAWESRPKGTPLSTWATRMILDGLSVKLYDVEEEEDDSTWFITLDGILKGIAQNAKERPWDADWEQGDATTADCIIQYAVFGEVVYG